MPITLTLHRNLLAALTASLLCVPAAHASSDDTCDVQLTLRQGAYSCGNVPMLSPGNDTRINALLMMVESRKVAQVFPDPKTIPAKERINQIVVPFPMDFSGWIYIGQKSPDKTGDGQDADPSSNRYADGEGSICRSMESGAQAFDDALSGAAGLPADEAARLRAARADIAQKTCAAGGATASWTRPPVKSALARDFATYLDGTNAFYRADFLTATRAFASASHSANPWLKETALYMTGRAQLNAAQANAFDNDNPAPSRARVTKVSLDAADTVFRTYLKIYPQGDYAVSATGLLRRIAWLGGNVTQQADLYGHALARWSPATSNVPLIQLANELDSKLLFGPEFDASRIQSPTVLATVDLLRMRTSDSTDPSRNKPLTLDDLQAQKPRFANAPALYDYLVATWYLQIGHKPDAALALLPQAPAAPLDYFGLSQQALRGFALEDSGKADQARQLWRDLIPLATLRFQREALELALAINLEQAGRVDDAFAADSPVQNAAIRAVLLQRTAGAALLRTQAQNPATSAALRDTALYTLLYKELTRGRYADFVADTALVSGAPADPLKPFVASGARNADGYVCPSARDIAAALQQNPADAPALNCLADFVRLHPPAAGIESYATPAWLRSAPAAAATRVPPTLGDAPSQFAGKPYERMSSYVTVIADAQANPNDRAYALYRAINCYAPAGSNECGGKDVPKSARKRWFDTLKTSYAGTPWARKLRYYW